MNDKIVLPEQRINRDNFDLLIPEMEIPSGKIFGIFGPSGCGKSTYLELVLKHLKSRNYSIANAYQEDTIFENLTVKQNIELGYDMLGIKIKDEYFDEIRAFCNLLDITDSTLKKHGKQLSGGERRRVLISRVVSPKPDILLLDEPFVGIGIKHEIALRKIIRARRTRGKYTILVSHDKALLWAICDHIILIGEGRLLGSIEPQKLDYKSFNFKTAELLGIKNNLPFELLESTIDVEYISPALREFIAQEKKGILFWSSWITCKESDDAILKIKVSRKRISNLDIYSLKGKTIQCISLKINSEKELELEIEEHESGNAFEEFKFLYIMSAFVYDDEGKLEKI